jgi:hypothetical protein
MSQPFLSPLFTEVPGRGILRTSPSRSSKKFARQGRRSFHALFAVRFDTSKQWVGHTYRRAIVASTKRCKRNREEVRRCNEGKKPGTGASKKKPAGSSRVRIGTVDKKL